MSTTGKQTLGPYELVAPIGAGGMGEVFRARDTRLNREVAIKVLPKEFASDPDRLRRFEQETKTLAALNHPNVLTIHDTGVQEGIPFLVSELLEGQTLRKHLSGGALSIRKATDFALQIAQGLAAAHGKGIIHRDLKPENIFLTKDGRVKILDFGLAKLQEDLKSQISDLKSSGDELPTLVESTEPGKVLGTPAYMSPEQVRCETADHRSDIFAFGCVFYEMLTGQRTFRRDTPVESMNAVLREEPPEFDHSHPEVPRGLERLIRSCLEKRPDDRFQSARDLTFAIEAVTAKTPHSERGGPSTVLPPRFGVGLACFLLLTGVIAFTGGLLWSKHRLVRGNSTAPSIRYLTYSGRDFSPAVSAAGKRVCFSSDRTGTMRIWVKDLISGVENALTEGPDDFPRFSPDESSILFTRATGERRSLYRVSALNGSEPFKIVDNALSGDWSPNGHRVAFVRWPEGGGSEVYVAGVDGSAETLLYRFADQRCSTVRWSPDGDRIATAINDSGRPQSLQLIDVRTHKVQAIRAPHPYNLLSSLIWDKTGKHLLFVQAESSSADSSGATAVLFRYTLASGITERPLWSPTMPRILDLLPNGNLVFDSRSSRENLKVFPIEGTGAAPRSLTLGNSTDRQPAYSPDGRTIVFSSNRGGNLDLWSVSSQGGAEHRLTDDPADDWDPAFSSDGRHVVWSSNRSGNFEIWIANADGSAPRQVTHDGFAAENPTMTPDDRWIVYGSTHPRTAGIWKIHPDGTGATSLNQSPMTGNAELSPDGRYAAIRDNNGGAFTTIRVVEVESGAVEHFEIRLRTLKETAALIGRVRWLPDGRKLMFLGQNDQGVNGLFVQDFIPGEDTTNTRRPVGPFDSENSVESFGISPDGRFIAVAAWEQFFSIMQTEDLE